MSRIDELIREHCPNGVEFKPLWSLTSWDKKFNSVDRTKQPRTYKYRYLPAGDLGPLVVPGGDVKILTTNTSDLWTTGEMAGDAIANGEVIAIPWGGNANVQHCIGRFITTDNRIARVDDPSQLSARFLFFFLLANINVLASFYRGAGIKHPSMAKVLDMPVPVPPLTVQNEIVRVLDLFMSLEAELEAELEARRRQYALYREALMAFELSTLDVTWATLSEIADFTNGKPHERVIDPDGDVALMTARFISTQGKSSRFVNRADVRTPATRDQIALVMSDLPNGRALARAFYVGEDNRYAANQRVCLLQSKDPNRLLPRFLFYSIDRNKQLLSYDSGVDQTHLKKDQILGVRIAVPSFEEQLRIVGVLDKFDLLVNDLSVGLPAELAARRSQYEYYRNRLLTFEEAA